MIKQPLSSQDSRALNANQKIIIDFTDINSQAGLTKTLDLLTGLAPGWAVESIKWRLVTPFVSGSATSLTLQVGWDYATLTDDPDGLVEAAQILAGHVSLVVSGGGTGAAFAAKATGFFPQESCKLTALLTSVTANLSTFTAGKLEILVSAVNLNNYVS